jgi:subtilisin family serine protease
MIAESGNNQGIAGVVPGNDGICLLVARAFGDASGGQLGSIITDAIEWCGDNDARLINMSLGGGFSSRTQLTVIQALTLEGVLIVAAAGNDGSEDLNFPASYQQTVSVGAVDRELAWAPFSQNNNRVDLVAPGVEIISTVPSIAIFDDTTGEKYDASLMDGSISIGDALSDTLADCGLGLETCVGVSGSICLVERGEVTFSEKAINCEDGGGVGIIIYNSAGNTGIVTGTLGGVRVGIPVFSLARDSGLDLISSQSVTIDMRSAGYGPKTGTSMATPVVTGVIARIWAARPECTNVQVREAVEKSALDLGESGRDNFYGEGLVQLEAAYTYLLDFDAPCGTGGVTASPTDSPTRTPSVPPTKAPTTKPTPIPTFQPTDAPASSPVLSTFFAPSQVSTSTRAPVLISQGIFTFSPVSNPQALQQTTPAPATPTFPYASFGAPSSVDAFFANDMDEETIDGSEDMSSSSSMAGLATSAANMSRVRGHFIAASTMMAILLVFG